MATIFNMINPFILRKGKKERRRDETEIQKGHERWDKFQNDILVNECAEKYAEFFIKIIKDQNRAKYIRSIDVNNRRKREIKDYYRLGGCFDKKIGEFVGIDKEPWGSSCRFKFVDKGAAPITNLADMISFIDALKKRTIEYISEEMPNDPSGSEYSIKIHNYCYDSDDKKLIFYNFSLSYQAENGNYQPPNNS